MKNSGKLTLGAALILAAAGAAQAGVTLDAARVGAVNVPATAKFYESAFGLKEVNRIQLPHSVEIMMNFGKSSKQAKMNHHAQVVVMHRASNDIKDPVPHIVLNVTDMKATVAAVEAAGGSMAGKPMEFGHTGIMIGIAMDPAGNRIEMIQQPHH